MCPHCVALLRYKSRNGAQRNDGALDLAMKYAKVQEEELKNKVAHDFFGEFDCTEIIEKVDFAVKGPGKRLLDSYLLWAEAKAAQTDVCEMLTQLVLTIGKARIFDKITPPPFLGCFDREKIAFIPYHAIQEIFYLNDFNWKVTPSNHKTREFKQVLTRVRKILHSPHPNPLPEGEGTIETYIFDFQKDEKELKQFIRDNFIIGKSDVTKILVDKNNFINIYNRWLEAVKPTIAVNWELVKKAGFIDGDFYLADLLSRENKTLKEKLFVLLRSNHYELDRKVDTTGFFSSKQAHFTDGQKAHHQFWTIYERPPLEEYWDYIIERHDLLVPQDIRERKGSFFTPRIWVELSQKYIADVLGENWQDEYYVWDCAAGTGNLLAGLTNKYHIWASTIDKADVDIMHDRIENGANLLKDHVFQFDFLNDDFSTLPKGLRDIINDPKRRKKLIVYINPPYAEVATTRTRTYTGENKNAIEQSTTHAKYSGLVGIAMKELFAQFLIRTYAEIPGCKLAQFSKLKALSGPNFAAYRQFFQAKLQKCFIIPSDTFDNVNGQFPIGFFIWDTSRKEVFKVTAVDVFDKSANFIGSKTVLSYDGGKYINDWIIETRAKSAGCENIAFLCCQGNDFLNQNVIRIMRTKEVFGNPRGSYVTQNNLIEVAIYYAVRKVIAATWLNDRDQFLYPNDGWQTDKEFQNDCLAYTLFNNNIQSRNGVNHWIPFLEHEVDAHDQFDSHFIMSFIGGRLIQNGYSSLFERKGSKQFIKRKFSPTAKKVFDAGRRLWRYYHAQPNCNVNASLYDIREHFQGRNDKGKMNNKSTDETYNELISNLRSALKTLAAKIEPKVYEYGFLKK